MLKILKVLLQAVSAVFIFFLLISLLFLLLFLDVICRMYLPIKDLKVKKLGLKYCRACSGSGYILEDIYNDVPCGECHGKGTIDWLDQVMRPRIK